MIIQESMGGGGAERVLVTLLNALDPKLYDITLLLIYKDGPFLSSIPAHVKIKWLFDSHSRFLTRLITHFYTVRNFIREKLARHALGKTGFDITVSFMEGGAAKLHSQLSDYSPKNFSWVHCNQRKDRWYDFWFKIDEEKRFYQKLDKVALVSRDLQTEFENIFKTQATKKVIYNPVNSLDLTKKSLEYEYKCDSPFVIVNCGRLVNQKNQELLIDVARLLRDRGRTFRVEILGSGYLYKQLTEKVRHFDLDDFISFHGFVENPFPIMKQADVFCMTSVSEGCPMVVAEALTLGLPVVSTPIGAVGEMLEDGGGIITDGSAEDIAYQLEYLMDHPEKLAEMKVLAHIAAKRFSLEEIIPQMTDFIDN